MLLVERLNGTKQCVFPEKALIIDYVYGTTRLIYHDSYMFCLSFGGEQLFYDILKYVKNNVDVCIQERDDDLYTVTKIRENSDLDTERENSYFKNESAWII